ncbi:transposase, partial [Ruthenibacterium lactatiformans]
MVDIFHYPFPLYRLFFCPANRVWGHSEWKGVKIVEAEVCPDHIHMLVEIPPKMSVAGYIGFLKGKSSLMIF